MMRESILPIIAVLGAIVSITAIVGSSVNAQQYQSGGNTPSSSTPSSTTSPPTTSNSTGSTNMTNATAGGNMTGVDNSTNSSMTK
jgi:hypothetical protein